MENARSLASRFSGLLLFLLSLAVVGVLVYLTVRSARDQEAADNQTATTQTDAPAEETPVTDANEAATDDASSAADDDSGQVAGRDDSGLPNTGPESAIAASVALGGLAFALNTYLDSRRRLKALSNR